MNGRRPRGPFGGVRSAIARLGAAGAAANAHDALVEYLRIEYQIADLDRRVRARVESERHAAATDHDVVDQRDARSA